MLVRIPRPARLWSPAGLILAAMACAVTSGSGAPGSPLPNPGFEEGATQWQLADGMSRVVAEAAHEGKMGLRVADDDRAAGSSVTSARFAVAPEQEVGLTFWARTEADFLGVYLWFYTSEGRLVNDPKLKAGGGIPICAVKSTGGKWAPHALKVKAPAGAASVAIWIHSYSTTTGIADLDDFALTGLAPDAAPLPAPPARPARPAPTLPAVLPARKAPPIIIIKLDDLRQVNGAVHPLWTRLVDVARSHKVKLTAGVICQALGEATPEYAGWIRERRAAGDWEFWFHGWDHGTHEVEGRTYNEFSNRPCAEQKKRFDDSQRLAQEKLGFPFVTFGPPGGIGSGSFDAETIRVMADDPHMKVWLYPQPTDAAGKKLVEAGKVIILDRVWDVNIEGAVGVPDYVRFVAGYAKHPDREYFVLQGHPMMWGDPARFAQFVKILDFLVAQKAVFMTPSEYAAAIAAGRAAGKP